MRSGHLIEMRFRNRFETNAKKKKRKSQAYRRGMRASRTREKRYTEQLDTLVG